MKKIVVECYFPVFILFSVPPSFGLARYEELDPIVVKGGQSTADISERERNTQKYVRNATKLDYPTIEIRIDKGTSIKVQISKLEKQKGAGRSQETLDRIGSNYLPWLFPSSQVSEESNEMMREGHRQGSILKRRWRRPSGSWGLGVAQ